MIKNEVWNFFILILNIHVGMVEHGMYVCNLKNLLVLGKTIAIESLCLQEERMRQLFRQNNKLKIVPESKSVALMVTTEDPMGTSSSISLEKLIGSKMGALSLRSTTFT